jgi:hypothetical protein
MNDEWVEYLASTNMKVILLADKNGSTGQLLQEK